MIVYLNNNNLPKVKYYNEINEKFIDKSVRFDLFFASLNNKCCYLSKQGMNRNSIEVMGLMKILNSFKCILDLYKNVGPNFANLANCNLQLCAFESLNKNYSSFI